MPARPKVRRCIGRTDELWHGMLAVNLTGTYHGIRDVLPGMIERKFGRIVNVASTAGVRGYPYVAAYCAAKHGVIGLTRALALEVAQRNITVNAVCPGYTETALVEDDDRQYPKASPGRSAEAARDALTRTNPQGPADPTRRGRPRRLLGCVCPARSPLPAKASPSPAAR